MPSDHMSSMRISSTARVWDPLIESSAVFHMPLASRRGFFCGDGYKKQSPKSICKVVSRTFRCRSEAPESLKHNCSSLQPLPCCFVEGHLNVLNDMDIVRHIIRKISYVCATARLGAYLPIGCADSDLSLQFVVGR